MATPTNLPASFVSGAILTAAQQNDLRGAFRILQVVSGSTNSVTTNSTTTFADTGLSLAITPQSSSSKILVVVSQTFSKSSANAANSVRCDLLRNSTILAAISGAGLYTGTAIDLVGMPSTFNWLDSPATASTVTYKTMFCNFTAAAQVQFNSNLSDSSILLMEVSA